MKLSPQELAAVCEYVDGRRAAGVRYDDIAEELLVYTRPQRQGEEPRLSVTELDSLEIWHSQWKRRHAYLLRQRASGDPRGGTGGIIEVPVDFAEADAGVMVLRRESDRMEPSLAERADTLKAVMYLKRSLLRAKWRWTYYKTLVLRDGMTWCQVRGPGRIGLPDGTEGLWLSGAVIIRRGDAVTEVMEECRKRRVQPAGWHGFEYPTLEVERIDLVGEKIDVRDIAARLAALLHTTLGGARSPFRNNEHLAQLLGVTREAMRVRKQRIMREAGMQSGQGLCPNRGNGGRASQARRIKNAEQKPDNEPATDLNN